MKRILSKISKIWFPALVVGIVAVQSFASDYSRTADMWGRFWSRPEPVTDTVIYHNNIYTKFRSEYDRVIADSLSDFLLEDSAEVAVTARDTMKVPDSLRLTDLFRYKYYVAIKDSLTHVIVRDSLKKAGDSLDWPRLDSLYRLDSIETAIRKFNAWYASLDKAARKKYDFEQKMKVRQQKTASSPYGTASGKIPRESSRHSPCRTPCSTRESLHGRKMNTSMI